MSQDVRSLADPVVAQRIADVLGSVSRGWGRDLSRDEQVIAALAEEVERLHGRAT